MGADGHWRLVKAEDWERAFPDVRPNDCGVYETEILGVRALAAYWDTSDRDDMEYGKQGLAQRVRELDAGIARMKAAGETEHRYPAHAGGYLPPRTERLAELEQHRAEAVANPEYAYSKRCLEAADWFTKTAEDHTVWT